MAALSGTRKRPVWDDPLLDLLIERGREHERSYVKSLSTNTRHVVDLIDVTDRDAAVEQTLSAMRSGADVIVQGALSDGCWYGRPDVIQRLEKRSDLGDWSYEISDTKLARHTRAGTILQLSLYSEMLGIAQGLRPEHFYVVTPNPEAPITEYRLDDYAAYCRLIRAQMMATVALGEAAIAAVNYPEPVDHCDVCAWITDCKHKWRLDDHLSLVAGISRLQRRELESRHVTTLAGLATLALPLSFEPTRGGADTYVRVREQARLQFESRGKLPPLHELRTIEPGSGLCRLPEPSPGDLFLDLEGDPFAREGGREYLFGVVRLDDEGHPSYRSFWGFTDHEERAAFESVIDLIVEAWKSHDTMHVYHYAPYEPSALKRLMGRYATREQELDRMLRGGRFVDLFAIVRQGVVAGIESYSIKNLEPLYDFKRVVTLVDANRGLRVMEHGLESGCPDKVPEEARGIVEGYNRDDCVSTLRLRSWLEVLRAQLEATGVPVARPIPEVGDASEKVDERAARVATLRGRLLRGVPDDRAKQTQGENARWMLAYMLDWHRREEKAGWWEYYRLRDLPEEDLFDEPQALARLGYRERLSAVMNKKTGNPTGSVIDRYCYPIQEIEIGRGGELKLQDGSKFGDVIAVDRLARTVDIRKGPKHANTHPTAVFAHKHISTGVHEDALYQIAESVSATDSIGLADRGPDVIARQLLLAKPPRLNPGGFVAKPDEDAGDFAVRIAGALDQSVLAIQGPPGSGKTFTGARMICALVAEKKRVGITANSHTVIRNLLDAVVEEGRKTGVSLKVAHKCDDDDDATPDAAVTTFSKNESALGALQSGEANVLGGTSWVWARPDFTDSVDVLFVDEAGQMSLANALAVSRSARSVVLLGDPQQLDQPQKGSHPEGVNVSALQHILGDHETIPADRGIFLPLTWRLAPSICAFTSELFYEGRLASKPGLESQRLTGIPQFNGNGLWIANVDHHGNCNSSPEEVEVVANLVALLTAPGARWIDQHGRETQMSMRDILIVAPYNSHVSRLTERLGATGIRIGTVDKFQGQAAPVVIYSTATSSPEDAPRGMEFLYSPNRLNVATSRAKCAAILVTNPRLFEPECKSPRQMKLANALCRYREMANANKNHTL